MSSYYKPHRKPDWNYGGPNWKLSRSKIDLFVACPRCFYVDNKLGVARPPGFPFNLNSAVDHLLKKEFDLHRAKSKAHPLMEKYGVDAVPFQHEKMDVWRENFKGITYFHEPTKFTISGAIDDIWVAPTGELIVVDYKATSKDTEVNLDADWQDGYKRQMEIYQWLFRQNGFKVSDTGYFVYCNGKRDKEAFDASLEFDIKLIPYEGSDSWVEGVIVKAKQCLDGDIPKAYEGCDFCNYKQAAGEVEEKVEGKAQVKKTKPKKPKKQVVANKSTLF